MNFHLTEEQEMIVDLVKEFAENEIESRIDDIEEHNKLPEGLFGQLGELGIIGVSMPERYGGSAEPYLTFILEMEEIGKHSPGLACALITTMAGMNIILEHGSEEQKEKYLEKCITGQLAASMAFTEAGTGSDPRQLTTTATEENGRIVLNGVKRFITNASYPGPMVVYAKDTDTGECSAYMIDKFCEGYSLSTPWEKVGLLGSPVYDVFLDHVVIPKENLLGTKGSGYGVLLLESARGKLGHAASALGIIGAAKEKAVRYAKEKLHRGKPITKFQSIQLKIAAICQKYESAKWMLYRAAALADEPEESMDFKAYAALVKGYISDLAPECTLMAMNVMGAYGTMKEYSVERHMRDALIQPHIEVVSDVQRIIYAADILRQ